MTLRQKAFGTIALIFLLASVLLYGASSLLIQRQFLKLETADTQKNTQRAIDALNDDVRNLATVSSDWSNWDDTYKFVVDHNQAYITSNLKSGSISSLGLNFMLFYDSNQKLVQTKGVDVNGNDLVVPPQLLEQFKPGSSLLIKNEEDTHTGFLDIQGKPVFFSARPILTSEATGTPHGTLVFAKYLAPDDITNLGKITHLTVQFYNVDTTLPKDTQAIRSTLHQGQVVVQRLNSRTIAGYSPINDIHGNLLLITRVELPRQAFVEAQNSVRYFLVVIAFVTLFSILLAMYIMNQVFARDKVIRVKDEFFSVASHEIRTPLTAIRGNATLLQDFYGASNDSRFTTLTTDIEESSIRLIRLVNNFLDAARFEQGVVPLTLLPTSLFDIAQSVVSEMQGLAHDKNIYIQSIIAEDIPLVFADADRVKQVIYNLAGNAAKFTHTGGVTLSAVMHGNFVKVYITDTGSGIALEDKKILFHKFKQITNEDTKSGSGLGLYISKMLVELMGGVVALEASEVGQGTTLSFTLPIASTEQVASTKTNTTDTI